MRTWKDAATLVKPRGAYGRFVARCAADFPFVPDVGSRMALVPPQTDLPRRVTVNFTRDLGRGTYEIGFDEVADERLAHGLAGCHCLIECESIDETFYEDEPATWAGWAVVDERGAAIGVIGGLIDNPGQALLEVMRGEGKPAYVPVVDEFIRQVDVKRRAIVVDLPAGLLDL